jgi:hypothetical protein
MGRTDFATGISGAPIHLGGGCPSSRRYRFVLSISAIPLVPMPKQAAGIPSGIILHWFAVRMDSGPPTHPHCRVPVIHVASLGVSLLWSLFSPDDLFDFSKASPSETFSSPFSKSFKKRNRPSLQVKIAGQQPTASLQEIRMIMRDEDGETFSKRVLRSVCRRTHHITT